MLKLAGLFLALMIVFGILGFVVDVFGGIAKILFFLVLIGFVVSLAGKYLKRGSNRRDVERAAD